MWKLSPRFRVRTVLLMVALAALALWSERMVRFHRLYLSPARFHPGWEDTTMDRALWQAGMIEAYQPLGSTPAQAGNETQELREKLTVHGALACYHKTLRAKYERRRKAQVARPPDPVVEPMVLHELRCGLTRPRPFVPAWTAGVGKPRYFQSKGKRTSRARSTGVRLAGGARPLGWKMTGLI